MVGASACGDRSFAWPKGKRAAVSLTFDDARPSQIDRALPILTSHGVKVTFYVTPANIKDRLADWRRAEAQGHEIGNHTLAHPCSGNFPWSRANALEEYGLAEMEADISGANSEIEGLLGVTPVTFAYLCGQTFVGRGEGVTSYVPLVAHSFLVGRGAFAETHNAPEFCDLAQVAACDADGVRFERLKDLVDRAVGEGGWLILHAHEVGDGGRQTTYADALDAVCGLVADSGNGLWVDTVETIGRYVNYVQEGD